MSGGREACVAFEYLGQPITSCDGCGRPAWEHDWRDGAGGVHYPWSNAVIGSWLAKGWIDRERAATLLAAVEVRHD